ncbi:MAG: pSRTUE45c [Streptosporangiaceae bacterium]|nr:pSRTUE45c [Streptosporangiaceae bacterium]
MTGDTISVSLLGGFEFGADRASSTVPFAAQRLLAFLALQDGWVHRATAAERLWPDSSYGRAPGNLRSALWHSRHVGTEPVIECGGPRLRLAPAIGVDLRIVLHQAPQIVRAAATTEGGTDRIITMLSQELLPSWPDEWLILARERWDQVRMHTLEALARQLIAEERYLPALEAAFAAVAIEPIRDSAHRVVIEVYIAEGNSACALKHYQRYRALIQRELGVTPSPRMNQLIHPLTAH